MLPFWGGPGSRRRDERACAPVHEWQHTSGDPLQARICQHLDEAVVRHGRSSLDVVEVRGRCLQCSYALVGKVERLLLTPRGQHQPHYHL